MPAVKNPPKVTPTIEKEIKEQLLSLSEEEKQVIVHCKYQAGLGGDLIRIWKSSFLYARDSSHKSVLINTQKITIYPNWTPIQSNSSFHFTLIFSGLPRSCKTFDLIENIPEPGGFFVINIVRNNLDVYHIDLN